ncbi:inter-alpha-trypsin inhibitor heavy chain H4-like [Zingiber officinale]|uniref:inter-alpha-trypsin inhibitor heavy chain H4-like n=1 Tax=Zingiber officinale TaxID=94328 RepID=UPI001C4BB0D6|nr:inter-alpha-trypsin inhibitor heavy chain H4-like [Zingiber officinale]
MAEEEEFARAVEDGLKLAKRVYAGKDRQVTGPPRPVGGMERKADSFLPSAPMVYAVISDPRIVDNPDIPSYQPHVYGRCDPPALIPLHMGDIGMEIDCLLDSAFVSVHGRWRVHCVMRNKSCSCRLVVPIGDQGSVLGVEIEVGGRSYHTQVIEEEEHNIGNTAENKGSGFLKGHIFYMTIPQVNGGSDISIKAKWSQKLAYNDGQFLVSIPFNFPEYVTPFSKVVAKKEKIQLNLNSGFGKELLIQKISHLLKEKNCQAGKLNFLYEANVDSWSDKDFEFSYSLYSNDLSGGILLKSPTTHDGDQRDMFCFYLFPGSNQRKKVFKNEIVFVVDVSGSMHGKFIENVKSSLAASLLELRPGDLFDIIAFNDELHSFSPCLEHATEEMVENAIQWMNKDFIAEGGTDIMHPLKEAVGLLSSTNCSIPQIFLITDGAVEDEHNICNTIKTLLANSGSISPRISTFGIGSYCNHYFLKILASIGRGQYDAAYDPDSIGTHIKKWFCRASSTIVANLTVDSFTDLDEFEVYSINIPDLSAQCPLIISGRFYGRFPETLQAKGILADMTDIVIDLKVYNTKDFPLEKALVKQHIDLLTAQAWFTESKQLEEKVAKLSIHNSIPSEYACMVLLQRDTVKEAVKQAKKKTSRMRAGQGYNFPTVVHGVTIGFGDPTATKENRQIGAQKEPEILTVYKTIGCCSKIAYCCCCPCCINTCNKLNDQLVIALTQLCAALSCLACSECCSELCGAD